MKEAQPMEEKPSNQRKGKSSEHLFFSMLLEQGLEVYAPLADDSGVDALARLSDGTFAEIQIKSRSPGAKHPALFADIAYESGRPGYWFAFRAWDGETDAWYLLNGEEFERVARREGKGTWALNIGANRETLAHCALGPERWDKFKKGV